MADNIPDQIPKKHYHPEPTIQRFHDSDAFFRGIRGPVGSGKSVGCCADVMARMLNQRPFNGVRRSRWAFVRKTAAELKETTIQTWLSWFGGITKMKYGFPANGLVRQDLLDGTRLEAEIVFIPMGVTENDERALEKIKSLDLTGAFCNEASELNMTVISMIGSRVGRYPPENEGGFTWRGIIADTNSCTIDNWWYKASVEKAWQDIKIEVPEGVIMRPMEWEFFDQPPALIYENGVYKPNPDAENINNLGDGYGYYYQQLKGHSKAWVKVYVLNQYGTHTEGNTVYADYCEKNECALELDMNASEIIWSHDFNFTPLSSIIMQRKGDVVYALDEIVLTSAVAKNAAEEFSERYKDFKGIVKLYGDASGHVGAKHGQGSDYITIEQTLMRNGFRVELCMPKSNPRIKDGQSSLQGKICDALGNRTFYVNPIKCPTLHKGLATLALKKGSTFQEEDTQYQHITTAVRYYTAVEFPVAGVNQVGKAGLWG